MSEDVEAGKTTSSPQTALHPQPVGACPCPFSAACTDDSDATQNGCSQLLPLEELVPLSQSLIPPSLARLLNLAPAAFPAPAPLPSPPALAPLPLLPCSQSVDGLFSDRADLQNMQRLEQQDLMREIAVAQQDDSRRMPMSAIFQESKGGDLVVCGSSGFKRPRLNAGLLDSYGMQLSDGDGADDQGEGYGLSQLVERENSSNSGDGGAGSGGGGTASSGARTLKRPRLVWTPQLHKRFVDAVSHLGIKNAVPKTIMQLMNVEGLTRENVASHLQKYRLYLRRVQQGSLFANCGNSPTKSMLDHGHHHPLIGSPMSPAPTVGSSDHLFNSSEIPPAIMASGGHHQLPRSVHLVPSGPINHLVHQHLQNPLLQPVVQHPLNQAMPVVKSPPLFNIPSQLDPRHYAANALSNPAPVQKAAWPSLYASSMDINAAHHVENRGMPAGPPSPPQQALSLFPH